MHFRKHLLALSLGLASMLPALAADIQTELDALAKRTPGELGACVGPADALVCVNGERRFPMQSVMKLIAGLAAFDAVDRGRWKLDDKIHVKRDDLSVFVQPLADMLGPDGVEVTVLKLVELTICHSDSAAGDILIHRYGGPAAVQAMLQRMGIIGVRLDRDEKDLQSEFFGLRWRPEYLDPAAFRAAINAVPAPQREAALRAYQRDPRDTATPRGMAQLLLGLAQHKLLSPEASEGLLAVMRRTATGRDRLRAGVPGRWLVAHKTGTSATWQGLTAATNDVGLVRAPNGPWLAAVAFVADSPAGDAERAASIAAVAAIAARSGR